MAKYVTRKYHIIVLLYVAFLFFIGKTYKVAIKSIKSYKLEKQIIISITTAGSDA